MLKGEGKSIVRFGKSSSVALRAVIFIVFLLSSSYFVVQVDASEPSLIEIFNYLGFTNVSETSVETFSAGNYNITLYAEFAAYSDENELSYYEVETSIFNVIFTGPEGGYEYISPPTTKTFTADYQFGLSMLSPGPHRYFTETSKNPDGEQHVKVYKNLDDPNMFLIGFENQYGAGDRDYNDMFFSLECTHNLTISAGVGGTTSPVPGTYSYDEGTNVQVTAIPDANYEFVYWELDGAYNGTNNPTTVFMNEDHTLKAIFAVITYTLTITTTTGGTTTPAPGTYTYDAGSSVSVQALPSANYMFDHWELDSSYAGTDNPTTVQMDDDHTLHAVFSLINYTLTITTTAGGTTDPAPGAYVYASGSFVIVTATPDINYKFIHWKIDGSNITDNPITVLMDKDYTLHAVFQLLTYRLTISSSTGGTTDPVPGNYVYVNGTLASVTAIPDVYYLFDYWELDGNPAGSDNPISVLMTDDHTLQAFFKLRNYTLTITATAGGTTDPTPGTYTYPAGTTVEVTAFPDADYVFDHWELDTVDVGSANPYTVLMDEDHTFKAVFTYSPAPPPLSVSISPPSATIPTGGSVAFTSGVDGGTSPYTYQWYLDGDPVSGATSSSWTFTPPSNGTYYVYVEVTDATSNKVQSDTAKITVIQVPVGGYSVSLTRSVVKTPLIFYTMLLAIFGVVMSLIRRKRK